MSESLFAEATPKRLLQTNPGPIKIVPQGQRDVWTKPPPHEWRCEHEDGRGRCSSRETTAYPLPERPWVEWLCEKHAPEQERPA